MEDKENASGLASASQQSTRMSGRSLQLTNSSGSGKAGATRASSTDALRRSTSKERDEGVLRVREAYEEVRRRQVATEVAQSRPVAWCGREGVEARDGAMCGVWFR